MSGHATELIKNISIVLMTHILNPLSLVIDTKTEFVNLKNGTVSVRRLNRLLAQIIIINKIKVQRNVYILSATASWFNQSEKFHWLWVANVLDIGF